MTLCTLWPLKYICWNSVTIFHFICMSVDSHIAIVSLWYCLIYSFYCQIFMSYYIFWVMLVFKICEPPNIFLCRHMQWRSACAVCFIMAQHNSLYWVIFRIIVSKTKADRCTFCRILQSKYKDLYINTKPCDFTAFQTLLQICFSKIS